MFTSTYIMQLNNGLLEDHIFLYPKMALENHPTKILVLFTTSALVQLWPELYEF